MLERPVIAITKPSRKDNWAYAAVATAIKLAGGQPVALTPSEQKNRLALNGVVFGGGQDILPMAYDGTPKQGYIYDHERDALEFAMARRASSDNIPTLGICRGAQLLNVVRGGSLHADMTAEYEDAAYPNGVWDRIFFRKCIEIEKNSRLRAIFGADQIEVNSLHKQAIKQLGAGLRATAKEKNGVVQAIEDDNHPFFIGVQFHPELLIYRPDVLRLFRRFVEAAALHEPVETPH